MAKAKSQKEGIMPKWPWQREAASAVPAQVPSQRRDITIVAPVTDGTVNAVVGITTQDPNLFEAEGFADAIREAASSQFANSTMATAAQTAARSQMPLYGGIQTALKKRIGEKVPPFQVVDFHVVE